MKNKNMSKKLTDSEQIILQKYFDNEASWYSSFRARALIKSNPNAQGFLDQLSGLSKDLNLNSAKPEKSADDLWASISARITQEERAEFYLGTRKSSPQKVIRPVWKNAAFGLGSAVTAFVLGVVFNLNYRNIEKPTTEVAKISKPAESDETITLASAGGINKLPTIPGGYFEVDWMKSDGRVQMIPHDSGNGGILWVRRLSPAKSVKRPGIPQNRLGATPSIGYNR